MIQVICQLLNLMLGIIRKYGITWQNHSRKSNHWLL